MRIKTIFFLFVFICFSCEVILKEEGAIMEKRIELKEFSRLSVRGDYIVQLIQDSADYIQIEAGENIIDAINLTYDSIYLLLEDDIANKYIRVFTKPVLTLHFTDIHQVFIEASCRLETRTPLKQQSMLIASTGEIAEIDIAFAEGSFLFYTNGETNGVYNFSGNVSSCNCMVYSASKLDISQLSAITKRINQNSVADAYIGLCEKLEVEINNRGKVYYTGEPEITYVNSFAPELLVKSD